VAFDAYVPMVAWTTRSADGVEVVVYRFDAQPGLFNRYPVPCSGKACEQVRLAAFDIGKIFITGADGSQVLDPSMGPDAHWAKVTDGRIVDVRNRVIIVDGARSMKLPAGADLPGWRMLPAATPTSVLTLEGGRQTDGTTTLQPTLAGVAPLTLSVPSGPGRTAMRLDNDGSLLVGRVQGDGDRYWDCDLTGACLEIGFVPGGMNPRFLGD
jgi:hypothetical protein